MQVLIPVDDMPYTLAALHSVAQRKWPAGTLITFCRVIEDSHAYIHPEKAHYVEQSQMSDADTEYHLQKAEKWLKKLTKVMKVENCEIGAVIAIGEVSEQLSALANKFSVDYIIIGSHDRTPAERAWLGSVAASVAESVNCSVEIVRPRILHQLLLNEKLDYKAVENIDYAPHRIVLATDFSENSFSALKWLCHIGCSKETSIALVTVDPPVERGIIDLKLSRRINRSKPLQEDLARQLTAQKEFLRKHLQAKFSQSRVLNGEPAKEILEFARKWEADLIVMGAHGDARKADAPVGSVTREVIDGSNCSVVAINAENFENICFDWQSLDKHES